ncbi:hypothetical protein L1987_53556 [Smallanthus sonchifolius]|uniref:Uncharacterized protein n=1 Tax=Smallanthus sonchifolius TaxID=185202 RepID=A0ACB9EXE5_9ASTR|nr:hypothetical protein L1987_53556 [Smallanthus sonchifolius]
MKPPTRGRSSAIPVHAFTFMAAVAVDWPKGPVKFGSEDLTASVIDSVVDEVVEQRDIDSGGVASAPGISVKYIRLFHQCVCSMETRKSSERSEYPLEEENVDGDYGRVPNEELKGNFNGR